MLGNYLYDIIRVGELFVGYNTRWGIICRI